MFKKFRVSDLSMEGNSYIVYHKQHPFSSSSEVFQLAPSMARWRKEGRKKEIGD